MAGNWPRERGVEGRNNNLGRAAIPADNPTPPLHDAEIGNWIITWPTLEHTVNRVT